MNDVKNTQILNYLEENGYHPVKIKYGSAWYKSPLRQEKTPSFKVDLNKNLWYDFGSGEGGTILNLVMKLRNLSQHEAIINIEGNPCLIRERHFEPFDESSRIKINRVQELRNPILIQYLKSRRIPFSFARRFLNEAYYSVHGKQYFALAFANDLGGYELRNAFFKTGSSPKYFTTIPGVDNTKLNIFEGFMDFLSCCTYCNKIPQTKTIVLNSLSFLQKIESEYSKATTIHLFLDNDQAGRKATEKVIALHDQVKDWAPVIYPDHKDFNEFLMG